jgi:3-deoxy-manno-octulosonate cytidylyltransferase (CMP-KDO synthetase)
MKVIGMIPARLESSRLPGKALIEIEGLPMVIHTCLRSKLAKKLDEVYLVTDNEKIKESAAKHNIKVIMTGTHHTTGSDRLAEACQSVDCDIVVNIQGDEPLVDPEHIDRIVTPLIEDNSLQIAVGVTKYPKKNSTSDIKAVLDVNDNIMYCSRNDLPSDARSEVKELLKMCFIVPFRKEFLLKYTALEQTPLEKIEYNEYLRVLENGIKFRAVHISEAAVSVDTKEDLAEVKILMEKDKLKELYLK